ncbi:MAG: pyruvate, phosphate dikinase [candidate division WOR-3 bacterium]
MKKYVYFFGNGVAEGYGLEKDKIRMLLGGKGAGLHEMAHAGLPVPPGFTITTEVCSYYYKHNKTFPEGLEEEVLENLKKVEEAKGQRFGDPNNPLLVSVRSGAPASMPGMMDTILNLGINDEIVKGLSKIGNERFAYDAYRRFIQMFGDVVLKIDKEEFERELDEIKREKAKKLGKDFKEIRDVDLDAGDWKEAVNRFKWVIKGHGKTLPDDPYQQLWMAIRAVFDSWMNPRAVEYRKIYKIPEDWGTACNVVAMVFGNLGDDSGTGVMFTRDPSTGEKVIYGEFLPNAQGEDIVAGIRTPMPLSELKNWDPEIYNQLIDLAEKLERYYREMQDIEFTIERKKVWLLQTRKGKRTPRAEIKIAVDMAKEGIISKEEAILRVDPYNLEKVLHPYIDEKNAPKPIASGIPASPGAATGKVVFDPEEAYELKEKGEKVILVRTETSPEDIKGMAAAVGILTSRGGKTSHAAVVARGMGKPAVVGAESLEIHEKEGYFVVKDIKVSKGDVITIDGGTGNIYLGDVPKVMPEISGEVADILSWADEYRDIGVRANADTPKDAKIAREFGAEGIGLARTEHMFFGEDRIWDFRVMILFAEEKGKDYERAKERIKNYQREDFKGILREMDGLPVIIRLLDPPLHEFLPKDDRQINEMAERLNVQPERIRTLVEATKEMNPMLGHRGVRLAITFPDIYIMQTEAIAEAYLELKKEGFNPKPKIMLPLVAFESEMKLMRELISETLKKYGIENEIEIGTMIELPRAAIMADKIAEYADFFSFGTNDLTQTTLGFSRDDVGKFLPAYLEKKILSDDPFQTVDDAVVKLAEMGVKLGKSVRKNLEVGVCGEHGGDPNSIFKFFEAGVDYVSASPFRVPVARLAAAQASIKGRVFSERDF